MFQKIFNFADRYTRKKHSMENMKEISTLLAAIFLSLFCHILAAQDNPYMLLAGKTYAEYSQQMHSEYLKFNYLDTVEARKVVRQIEEVARQTGNMEWKLRADRMELELYIRKNGLYGKEQFPEEKILQTELALLEKAKKENLPIMELEFRLMIFSFYWHRLKNYELAFEQTNLMDEQLQKIATEDFPMKAVYYASIAEAHYHFKDYPRAIYFFGKILEEQESTFNQPPQQRARNGMGLCYLHAFNDLDRSDSCFRAIMQVDYLLPEEARFRDLWNGIAEGNLGYNMLRREAYDEAIPLLKSSMENVLKFDDYGFASGPALNLADIYLKTNNLSEAKRYLDLAMDYNRRMPREGRPARIYTLLSKYCAATGNPTLSMAYADSMAAAYKKDEAQFNALQLMRVEQRKTPRLMKPIF